MKVLIDAMRDGIDDELIKHDYEAYSVKKLCEQGEKLQSDYSIIKHAARNNMVLVTEDGDSVQGCIENEIDCVQFNQFQTLDYLLSELEKIRIKRDSESIVLIPKERLPEGFNKCCEHAAHLINDSKKMYVDKHFVSSIALSILAHEEIGKLDLIRTHIIKKSDITKEEWDEFSTFGSHSNKLISFYQLTLDDVKKLGKEGYDNIVKEEKSKGSPIKYKTYEEVMNSEVVLKTQLKKFNSIKKACFYLDWKENNWFSIRSFYSEHELALLANFLLDFTGFQILTEELNYKYPSNFFHQVPDAVSIMKHDEFWIEREKYVQQVYSEEFQNFLNAVYMLIAKFPK